MIRSESLSELNAALSAAQGEFEAVDKSAGNPFFKSKYAPLPEVVKAATPILSKHGLAVWQGSDTDEGGELLWTVVLHSSGQYIGSASRLLPIKNDPQAQGSAVTYQRRYQYMAALGLVADEDDDGNAATQAGNRTRSKPSSRQQSRRQANVPTSSPDGHSEAKDASQAPAEGETLATEEQLLALRTKLKESGVPMPEFKAKAAESGTTGKPDTWTEDQATWMIVWLDSKIKERAA